jgi:hypothetical protein
MRTTPHSHSTRPPTFDHINHMGFVSKIPMTLIVAFVLPACSGGERTTAFSLSPDHSHRVRLVEVSSSFSGDKQNQIKLEDMASKNVAILFSWPDEGRPKGSERFLWSKDGTWFLLLGRQFILENPIVVNTLDEAYFLYHLRTRRAWCHSSQQTTYPHFTRAMLEAIPFTEPLEFEPEERGGGENPRPPAGPLAGSPERLASHRDPASS